MALRTPEKIAFVKQMVASGPGSGLAGIRGLFHGKVNSSVTAFLRMPPNSPLSAEFAYATTGEDFFRRIHPDDYKKLRKKEPARVSDFLRWLLANPEIMLCFNELGPTLPDQKTWFSDWFEIWSMRNNSHDGVGQKAALVLAHVNANEKIGQDAAQPPATALLARYDWFMKSLAKKEFLRDMETISHFDLRFVLGSHFSNSDLEWCQKRTHGEHFSWRSPDKIANAFRLVPYRSKNAKNIHISDTKAFYEGRPLTIETYVTYGGQCVAVSRTGAAFCTATGVPTFLVTQPNHLAFFWKDTSNRWRGGNDVSGWNFSDDQKRLVPWAGPPELVILYDKFHSEPVKARYSEILTWAARSERAGTPRRIALLKAALLKSPANYETLNALLAEGLAQNTGADKTRQFLLETGFSALTNHPVILQHLLSSSEVSVFLQHSKLKAESIKFRSKIYEQIARADSSAVAGSPMMAATRFLQQNCPTLKVPSGKNPGETHNNIRAKLLSTPNLDEKPILAEVELAWTSLLSNAALADAFFVHSVAICTRKPSHKFHTLRLLESFENRPATTPLQKQFFAKWKKEIGAISDTLAPEPRKSGKDNSKAKHDAKR